MTDALSQAGCAQSTLISSLRPSDYGRNLQQAADHHSDLVIAGSFLLTDAVAMAARANPAVHFLLVDPLVTPAAMPNLTILTFRRDQNAFLAGALAAMLTETNTIAGVYGPGGADDRQERTAFAQGASYVRPAVTVLGAYQPAGDGAPYANPAWGESQARAFAGERADVIFGAGGATGNGALVGAAAMSRLCIGVDLTQTNAGQPACLVASAWTSIDVGVELEVLAAARGLEPAGLVSLGLKEHMVGLDALGAGLRPDLQQRLQDIVDQLIAGSISTGV